MKAKLCYMHAKDPSEAKYQLLINKREDVGLKHYNDSKAFIEYSNNMDGIYEDIEEYHLNKERKMLILFDDVIADITINLSRHEQICLIRLRFERYFSHHQAT